MLSVSYIGTGTKNIRDLSKIFNTFFRVNKIVSADEPLAQSLSKILPIAKRNTVNYLELCYTSIIPNPVCQKGSLMASRFAALTWRVVSHKG